jgi:hypothetical protein
MSISDDPTEVLPATRAECRALLAILKDELASIKAQIAAVDLERQARGGRLDARWFHRAKTAQRHRQRRIEAVTAHLRGLPPEPAEPSPFRDRLITALRSRVDEATWATAVAKAREQAA